MYTCFYYIYIYIYICTHVFALSSWRALLRRKKMPCVPIGYSYSELRIASRKQRCLNMATTYIRIPFGAQIDCV